MPIPEDAFEVKLMVQSNENSKNVHVTMTNNVPILFIEFRLTDDNSPENPSGCSDFLSVEGIAYKYL